MKSHHLLLLAIMLKPFSYFQNFENAKFSLHYRFSFKDFHFKNS